MIEQLRALISSSSPKNYGTALKSNKELHQYVMEQTGYLSNVTLSERLDVLLNSSNPICLLGNKRRFLGFGKGHGGCGRPSVCECSRKAVSDSCRKTLARRTKEEVEESKRKRAETNLAKYGHVNAGQSEKAIAARIAFYRNEENVKAQVKKQRDTWTFLHGKECTKVQDVPGYYENLTETLRKKYGEHVTNISHIEGVALKSALTRNANGRSRKAKETAFNKIVTRFNEKYNLAIQMEKQNIIPSLICSELP